MSSTHWLFATTLIVATLFGIAGCASPPPDPVPADREPAGPPIAFEPCVAEAIQLDASAWRDHVRDLRELVVTARPQHEALASVGMTMRLATIDLRERRMRWLLEHDPSRFDVTGDAQAFRTISWSDGDAAALAAVDPTIVELKARREELGAQYAGSVGLDLFAEWYNAELVQSDGYRAVVADLLERERAVERLLTRCEPPGANDETRGNDD